ncbi:hypothetical protein JTB14_025234 [Gonioctena quinquepunctata]|nr:hypothetical protein JTB14_025234 [Gonioctena quinquepunctata]
MSSYELSITFVETEQSPSCVDIGSHRRHRKQRQIRGDTLMARRSQNPAGHAQNRRLRRQLFTFFTFHRGGSHFSQTPVTGSAKINIVLDIGSISIVSDGVSRPTSAILARPERQSIEPHPRDDADCIKDSLILASEVCQMDRLVSRGCSQELPIIAWVISLNRISPVLIIISVLFVSHISRTDPTRLRHHRAKP